MKTLIFTGLCMCVLLFGACGDKSGSLSADLDTTLMTNPQNIAHYISVISSVGSDSLFFPSNCLQCSGGGGNCGASQKCIAQNCGFEPSGPFSLDITFGNFSDGATIQLVTCALDNNSNYIGYAQTTTNNTDGEKTLLVMEDDNDDCEQIMPPLCI